MCGGLAIVALARKRAGLAGRIGHPKADIRSWWRGWGGIDVQEKRASVTNEISRGAFAAAFLLQRTETIGRRMLRLDDA